MLKQKALFFLFFLAYSSAFAQDPQLSQYYNSPLTLNPALAGTGIDTRVGVNYRLQWPSLGDPYSTFSAWADHDFAKAKSGLGLLIGRDVQGASKLSSTQVSVLYSYQVNLSRKWGFRPGIQAGFGERSVDYSKAIFGDQLNNNGLTGAGTTDNIVGQSQTFFYPDISAGGILYNQNLWIGLSANHLNTPNQAFSGGVESPLPMKFSIQGGYKILLMERDVAWGAPTKETSITPTFIYNTQGGSAQMDAGLYFTHDPIMIGAWYRGIPFKQYQSGIQNNESIILMAGFYHNGFSFGYSYDINISKLAGLSGGAHEISLIYQWQTDKKIKRKQTGPGPIPCPNFRKRFKKV